MDFYGNHATKLDMWNVIIMLVIALFAIAAIGILIIEGHRKYITEHWVEYRCKPYIMPFAGMFGKDTVSNFQYCTMTGFKSYAGYLMEPVNYILSTITSTMGDISSSIDDIRGHIYSVRSGFMGIVGTIFGKLQNTMSEVIVLVSRIRDIISRLIGVVAVLAGTLTVATSTTQSILNGPVGQVAEFVCWDPETPIDLADGTTITVSKVYMGAELKTGAIVESIMSFDASGVDMYDLGGIIVSGDHLFFDENSRQWMMVKSSKTAKKIQYTKPFIHCLNTDTHEVLINGILFRDFEETEDRVTVGLIQTAISNRLNIGKHPWIPKGVSGMYETGFHRDTVIMAKNGRTTADRLTIGDKLVDGSEIKGIMVYEGTSYVNLPGDVRVLPDTLVRIAIAPNNYVWTRARYVAPTVVEPEPSIFVQFLTTNNMISLMGSNGALTWIRDDNECNDHDIFKYRTSLVLKKLNAV